MTESDQVELELSKRDMLEQLGALVRARFPAEDAERIAGFALSLYADVSPHELGGQRPDHLYAAAVSLLRFAEGRSETSPALRVFTPNQEEHGWHTPLTVVELVQQDMPFLLDSIIADLMRVGADILFLAHPILEEVQGPEGGLSVKKPENGTREGLTSFIHLRVRGLAQDAHDEIEKSLRAVVSDVWSSIEDFAEMQGKCHEMAQEVAHAPEFVTHEEREEIAAFLAWLHAKHFVYLGYRYVELLPRQSHMSVRPRGLGLGVLREPDRRVLEDLRSTTASEYLRILKTNSRSRVHRSVHMDAVVLADFTGCEPGASPRGAHLLVGLFTLAAYARSTANIPLLRTKVRRALAASGYLPGSFSYKALSSIYETYPRDELFQVSDQELWRISQGILELQTRRRVALFARRDPFKRFVSCLVYVPRDRLDTRLRNRFQRILCDSYGGTLSAYYTRVTDEPLARLHLIIKTTAAPAEVVDHRTIERRLQDAARSWEDRLEAALLQELGELRGTELTRAYGRAFSTGYTEVFDELAACADIAQFEDARSGGEMALRLFRPVEAAPSELRLKLYATSGSVALSDVVPRLENMGLRVVGEAPYEVRRTGVTLPMLVHDFTLLVEREQAVELSAVRDAFADVFRAVSQNRMANDGFNKLVLAAGLKAREILLLRAYAAYLQQSDVPFSMAYKQRTLARYPAFARLLVELFQSRFRPEDIDMAARAERSAAISASAVRFLDSVANSDEDRILRSFLNVLGATLRTNYYQTHDGRPKPQLSLKFDSRAIDGLPEPRPYREIFVFSHEMEGVHLRFGPVARGGLRWSDRREDFRTEVLGLVKAQQVKNAVIVPVGSKGGFVVKSRSEGLSRDATRALGVEAYKTFIRGLLDLTDNRVGSDVQTPPRTVVYDDLDPYLVVAADKGTATFSDVANALSSEYGFWLGDAFASGGSAGYDHKKMGITARGAWESVKRHFRELNKDIQSESFTVCGVGDMSGDVFGNGMLLSRATQLVAAFNHQHIFLDPNPEPEPSWRERRRLFELPQSSWADYDQAVISEGGGVFERAAKTIEVSAEVAARLAIEPGPMAPSSLIRAILRAPVELLFFGGIGTYVKATGESSVEVGDRSNDGLRVDGREVRAKVIGEGANLAVTQRARVEYALAGGRCHTDFIDNSAGVDCSDHEVNIKILLGHVEAEGEITRRQRDDLLYAMTEEVAALVLRDNYLQTRCLSVTQYLGDYLTERLGALMRYLEKQGALDRTLEFLPDAHTLSERKHRGHPLTRPELSVVLSHTKNQLYAELLASAVPDEPYLQTRLFEYFPSALRSRFQSAIEQHRLRREIIATSLTNDVLNLGGAVFVYEAAQVSQASPARVVRAFAVARDVLEIDTLTRAVDVLDGSVSAAVQAELYVELGRALYAWTTWLLGANVSQLSMAECVARYQGVVRELKGNLAEVVTVEQCQAIAEHAQAWQGQGVPEDTALRVAQLPLLSGAGEWTELAEGGGVKAQAAALVYHSLAERLAVGWIRATARALPTERIWDRQAVVSLLAELARVHRAVARAAIDVASGRANADAYSLWCATRGESLAAYDAMLGEARAAAAPSFALLTVLLAHIKSLAES